ncbi:MAG: inosine/xanthosine triphosphatase [Chloroflexi bacterium]|nr:inosine/xanthosine triphosphatase [Chloroflexota bacterium]
MQQLDRPSRIVSTAVVGTTNPAKLAAVENALKQIWPQVKIASVNVDSGVRAQPLSDQEAILGATNRARLALASIDADLGIGVEGNTVEIEQGMFSTAWVVVVDRVGVIGLGSSGRFLLPEVVTQAVRQGGELGPLMDELTGEQNTKHKQGAVGILTNNLITRSAALETAVIFALTRFINSAYYA